MLAEVEGLGRQLAVGLGAAVVVGVDALISRAILGVEAARLTQPAVARGGGKGGQLGRVIQRFAVVFSSIEELALRPDEVAACVEDECARLWWSADADGQCMVQPAERPDRHHGAVIARSRHHPSRVPRTPGFAHPGGVTEHLVLGEQAAGVGMVELGAEVKRGGMRWSCQRDQEGCEEQDESRRRHVLD